MISVPRVLGAAGYACRYTGGAIALYATAKGVSDLATGILSWANYMARDTVVDNYGLKQFKNFLSRGERFANNTLGGGLELSLLCRDADINVYVKSGAFSLILAIGILYIMQAVGAPAPLGDLNKVLKFTPLQLASWVQVPFAGTDLKLG